MIVQRLYHHLKGVFSGLSIILLLMVQTAFICVGISYTMTVAYNHVAPIWPYISDTGAMIPERCWFALFLNLTAFFLYAIGYFRYCQEQEYLEQRIPSHPNAILYASRLAFFLSMVEAFGLSLVANFQETTVAPVHYAGAALAFGGGGLYVIVQSIIAHLVESAFTSKFVAKMRIVFGSFCLLLSLLTVIASKISKQDFDIASDQYWDWSVGDPGYVWHVISTGSEWLSASCLMGFYISLIPDFQLLYVRAELVRQTDLESRVPILGNP